MAKILTFSSVFPQQMGVKLSPDPPDGSPDRVPGRFRKRRELLRAPSTKDGRSQAITVGMETH